MREGRWERDIGDFLFSYCMFWVLAFGGLELEREY